ncbi:11402_t:CDS:2, partial [Paraglomus brasilianum]
VRHIEVIPIPSRKILRSDADVFDRLIRCFVNDVIGDLFIDTFKLEHDVYEITKILGTRTVEVKVGWVFLLFALVNSVAFADSVASAPAPEYVV